MAVIKKYWTYGELRDKVEVDLDLQNEDFITPAEMLGYANEAVDDAEQDVMGIYEDYYLDRYQANIVGGTDEYSLPPNIYAQKIRRLVYRTGNETYTVKRIPDWHKFEEYALGLNSSSSSGFCYFMINTTPGDPKMLFSPTPASSGTIDVWYTRQANRFLDDTDILDIEEAHNFVIAYMKYKCIFKEVHGANTAGLMAAKRDMDEKRGRMIASLTVKTPDAENNIEIDYSSYEDMS